MEAQGVLNIVFDPISLSLKVAVDPDAESAATRNEATGIWTKALNANGQLAVVVVG